MSYFNGPRLSANGLVIHLDSASIKSYSGIGTTWNNIVNNSTNATLINTPTYSTNNRGVFNFDGTNNRAEIIYSSNNFLDTNFTWSIWLLGTVNNNAPMPVIGYGSGSWPRLGWRLNGSTWQFSQYDNLGPGLEAIFGAVSTTSWLNLTLVADYTNRALLAYRNGVLNHTVNSWKTSNGNFGNLGLARAGSTSWPNALLLGSIGPFMIYNRALSASDVLTNYNAMKGRFLL